MTYAAQRSMVRISGMTGMVSVCYSISTSVRFVTGLKMLTMFGIMIGLTEARMVTVTIALIVVGELLRTMNLQNVVTMVMVLIPVIASAVQR